MVRHGCLLLLVLAPLSLADIYRWTDAQGRVHFADKAPANGTPNRVLKPDSSALNTFEGDKLSSGSSGKDYLAAEKAARQRKKQQRLRQEKQQAKEARRAQQCEQARSKLNILQRQTYSRTDLSSLMKRRQQRARLQDSVKSYCYPSSR